MSIERGCTERRQNIHLLIANHVNFCRNTTLNPRDTASVFKMLLVNMKSIDRQKAWVDMFPGNPYIHWEYVEAMTMNSMGDFAVCILMTSFLQFPDIEAHYKLAMPQTKLPYLHRFRQDVAASGLPMTLEQTLRMLLLANTIGLVGHNVLEQYTSRLLNGPTREMISTLMAHMADYRYTQEQYAGSICWILQHAAVDASFDHEIETHFAQRESVAQAMKMKHLEISVGRPRLVDKLSGRSRQVHSVTLGAKTSAVTGDAMDSLENWITRVRFPNTISQKLKRRLYVVMAQPHLDHDAVVGAIANKLIAPAVLREKIARPDERVIADVVQSLNMQQAPFAELTLFMRSCFRAFPQKDLREMTLLKYMQLYLASYQHADLWKSCWVSIHPLLSYQVIKDVEDFVRRTPFNQEAFVAIILTE